MRSIMKLHGVFVALLLVGSLGAAPPEMTVYKTKTCGCCGKWVEHMRANGFNVTVKEVPVTAPYRKQFGVPEQLASCHTAVVGGYAIEGHVPAAEVMRLVKEHPKAKGIAVPGMPTGSPGMEGSPRDAYSVTRFDADGKESVYQKYAGEAR